MKFTVRFLCVLLLTALLCTLLAACGSSSSSSSSPSYSNSSDPSDPGTTSQSCTHSFDTDGTCKDCGYKKEEPEKEEGKAGEDSADGVKNPEDENVPSGGNSALPFS